MKNLLRTWTATQLFIFIASLLIIIIGCERQRKAESSKRDSLTIASMGTVSIDTCVVRTAANSVRFDTVKVDTASFIIQHSELQPGY